MEDIIQKIVDVEKQALSIDAETESISAQIVREIEEETARLEKEALESAEDKVKRMAEERAAEAEREIARIQAESGEKLQALQDIYAKNRERWINEIVKRVTEG